MNDPIAASVTNRSIREAAALGQLEGLVAMRDKLAEAMDLAEPSVVAQIASRLQAVLKEIAELSKGTGRSALDDLAARRAARVAVAHPTADPKRRVHKRGG